MHSVLLDSEACTWEPNVSFMLCELNLGNEPLTSNSSEAASLQPPWGKQLDWKQINEETSFVSRWWRKAEGQDSQT